MNLIETVKKRLEAKGWDFSSDYWSDEELAAFYEVITETEAALRETDVSGSLSLTDDIIAQLALDHLKEIGSVDRKDLIYHDFTAGAMAYRNEQKRRQ